MVPTATVNGTGLALDDVMPHSSALDALRGSGWTGAKEGCAEGECGACAVLVRRATTQDADTASEWVALNACLMPAAAMADCDIITSEGLSPREGPLHPAAAALASNGSSQCGYCTPGFVCSAAGEYYRPGRTTFDVHALFGNLCRCTGYRPIIDAVTDLGLPEPQDALAVALTEAPQPVQPFDRTVGEARIVRPATLAEALDLLADEDAHLVAGSTDHGVEVNVLHRRPPLSVLISHLPQLVGVTQEDGAWRLGAATPMRDLERAIGQRIPLLANLFPQFASPLVRATATLGGNLGTASPIGDSAPALMALDAQVELMSRTDTRVVDIADFFTGYRTTVMRADELISAILVPSTFLDAPVHRFIKIAKRCADDISSVSVAVCVSLDDDNHVTQARLAAGGVAATPLRAYEAEEALKGRRWEPSAIGDAAEALGGLGTPMNDQRASADYRRAMLSSALLKTCHESEVSS